MQDDREGMQQVCTVLPILAYGDISRQPGQDLRVTDCCHFIQLAQCALHHMLHQASNAHAALVRLPVIVHVKQSGLLMNRVCRA